MSILFERAAIVGVGLIGGSLAAAARRAGCVRQVVGVGRGAPNLAIARERGLVDEATRDPSQIGPVDLVVLAVPVESIVPMARALGPHLRPGTVVTDVGSVKGSIVTALEDAMPSGCAFVGSHPIAGTEEAGAAAADPDLFQGAPCVLTPTERTDEKALERVEQLWQQVGARVMRMDPGRHDRALAWTSHLVHVLAYTLARAVDEADSECFAVAGPSLRDATRVAASKPELWRDIFFSNSRPLLEVIDTYATELESLRQAISSGDADRVVALLESGRAARRRLEERLR